MVTNTRFESAEGQEEEQVGHLLPPRAGTSPLQQAPPPARALQRRDRVREVDPEQRRQTGPLQMGEAAAHDHEEPEHRDGEEERHQQTE